MVSALLTTGILLGIVFLLIFLFSLLHKKVEKKILATRNAKFDAFVSANNFTIDEREDFKQYYIAIDSSNLTLLYVNFGSTEEELKVVDLQKIKAVKVDIEEKSSYENRKGKPVFIEKDILKLQLLLTKNDVRQTPELLTFYQYQDGMADNDMLKRRMEYWKDKITDCIGV